MIESDDDDEDTFVGDLDGADDDDDDGQSIIFGSFQQ